MKKNVIRWIVCIVAVCLCLPGLVSFGAMLFVNRHENQTELSRYRAEGHFPDLETLPEADSIRYQDHHWTYGFRECDSRTLWVRYDPDTYNTEKARLEEIYRFQTVPFEDMEEETVQPSFDFGTYTFRLLALDEGDISYPSSLFLVGTSDTRCAIAYIHCLHPDLPSIDDFKQFLTEDCGWGQTFDSELP